MIEEEIVKRKSLIDKENDACHPSNESSGLEH